MKLIAVVFTLLLISGFALFRYDQVNLNTGDITASVDQLAAEAYDQEAFRKAYEVIPFNFPEDLGAHPEFRIEWWYYTGNLADADGNRFGYQFTIFRRAIELEKPTRESEWGTNQIYFAHFTVTDVTGETFTYHERYSRPNPGLAGAQGLPFYHVWIDDWFAKEIKPGQVQLKAQDGDIAIDLILEQAKPVALQGDQGLSQKSAEPGNANYYYSQTDNPTSGTITTPRGVFEVTGNTWKDHEWGTSDLPEGTEGWDWFSLQLDDGRDVMFFTIRREDGGVPPIASGLVVYPDGSTRSLTQADVQVIVLERWTSPRSGAVYPAGWNFSLPSENIELTIKPLLNDQELGLSFVYWEGAVRIEGSQTGYGYIEMTGYAKSMRGRM